MDPKFSSYKINPKHRVSKPSGTVSIWTVGEWDEVELFAIASANKWHKNGIFWAVMKKDSKKLLHIGKDLDNDLCIAKYRCDSNLEWHGYPVHPRDHHDIPPNEILEEWLKKNLIDKRDRSKIQKGQFRYEP